MITKLLKTLLVVALVSLGFSVPDSGPKVPDADS
jgi:hypothetical protein